MQFWWPYHEQFWSHKGGLQEPLPPPPTPNGRSKPKKARLRVNKTKICTYHTTNSGVWPVPYACAQSYYPGSGSHGQLFRLVVRTDQHGIVAVCRRVLQCTFWSRVNTSFLSRITMEYILFHRSPGIPNYGTKWRLQESSAWTLLIMCFPNSVSKVWPKKIY